MRRSARAYLAMALCALLTSGCAASAQTAGSTASPSEGKAGGKTLATRQAAAYDSIVNASRAHPGLFTLYQDTALGGAHLAVRPDQIGREYIYHTHITDGVVAAGAFRGQFRDERIVSVRRHFNRIELLVENTGFWFDSASALSRAASANISPAVLASLTIVARDTATGTVLVKADELFLSEQLSQIKPSPNPNTRPGTRFALGDLSRDKTKYLGLRSYPRNTDVVVEYVYDNPRPVALSDEARGGSEVTDPRYVSIRMQHSFIALPENDFAPRYDDPRVGYFTSQVNDMTSARAANWRDPIHRWHLVKKDPAAAVSEPVEPIVWWIENTTPMEFRETIRQAVLAWNVAFEAAGFRNAIVVNIQPDDAEWDAGDVTYNVLRWTSSPQPPFGGYGPSFVNPRTGQILGADVMLEYVFVTNRLRQDRLFDVAALGLERSTEPAPAVLGNPQQPYDCSLGAHLHRTSLFGLQALQAAGASDTEMREYIESSLYYLALHEVGHTLGLNHNMKASQMLTPEETGDRSIAAERGLTGSVMDYPAANIAAPGATQGMYFTTRPGPYDLWAIEFGYAPALPDAAADAERRAALLARSTEPQLAFGNDADDMRSPGKAIDPRVMINDMSSDPLAYSEGRFELIARTLDRIRGKYASAGQSWHDLRGAYLMLTGEHANAASVVSRYVGGVYVDRAFAGQPGATQPFRPVSLADQRRAMRILGEHVFGVGAFGAPDSLLAWLQPQRRGFDHFTESEDPKLHARILKIQGAVLDHLLHPATLARMTDSRHYGNEYPVAMMLPDLTQAIFAADLRGNVGTVRQNLQLEYATRLGGMLKGERAERYDYVAQSGALAELTRIRTMLRSRTRAGAETAAHTRHLLFVVDRALAVEG